MTEILELTNLSFAYTKNGPVILNNINFAVKKGEVLGIVGLSGSGKTTLAYCLSGVIPRIYPGKLQGEVLVKGSSIKDMDLHEIVTLMGIVFQNPETQLFFPVVEDEIAFGPENLCIKPDLIGDRVKEVLSLVDMDKSRLNNPHNLSGGQKQLIALASVLSLKPEILIFDETMVQIDKKGRELIKKTIVDLKKEGKTIILIEHDVNNLDITDRIMLLKQGRLHEFTGKY